MAVTPNQLTVSAKLMYFSTPLIDRSATTATAKRLFSLNRDIVLVEIFAETIEAHLTAAGSYLVGIGSDTNKFATITVPISGDAAGDITQATFVTAAGVVRGTGLFAPKNVAITFGHTLSANAGTAFVHCWYYFVDETANTQV